MDPQSTPQPLQPPQSNPQSDSSYPPQVAPPVPPEAAQTSPPDAPPPEPQFGPPVPLPGETADINQLVREVQLADGVDVGRNWYGTLRINPKADTQTMFDTFMAKYEQDFPYLELPDESTKRFPKQSATSLGAHIIRPGEPAMSYEEGLKRGYQPVESPISEAPADQGK